MIAAVVLFVAGVMVLALHRPLIRFSEAKARMPAPSSAHTFGVIRIGVVLIVMAAVLTANQ